LNYDFIKDQIRIILIRKIILSYSPNHFIVCESILFMIQSEQDINIMIQTTSIEQLAINIAINDKQDEHIIMPISTLLYIRDTIITHS